MLLLKNRCRVTNRWCSHP